MDKKIFRIGISGCLLGQAVRYDGGHKKSSLCTTLLAPIAEFVSFCPEEAAGLGTPRPAMRLVGDAEQPKLVQIKDPSQDLGPQLEAGYRDTLEKFEDLDGFILTPKSPSCGLYRVKLYRTDGQLQPQQTQGLFARALCERFPLLPVEEEGRLRNPQLFDSFMLRVQAYRHFKLQVLAAPSQAALTAFHARYKYLLMAHHPQQTQAMGQYLATTEQPLAQRCQTYLQQLMQCLNETPTRGSHTNALQHMLGYLRGNVDQQARQLLANSIEQFRHGEQPLQVPLNLLQHYAAQLEQDYLLKQQYFLPYPAQLHPLNRVELL